MASEQQFPKRPQFDPDLVENCKREGDFRPILFEWYKHVGLICNFTASIVPISPGVRPISSKHFAVLSGLLNRCSRLMLANVRLSSTRCYGETTRIIDRSIAESAVKVQWMCQERDNTSRFTRFLADGLKKDSILKEEIESNIRERNGKTLVIEERMLSSIERCLSLSGLSEDDVREAKRLPDFASMCRDLGYEDMLYTAIQRMGSHAVHGTWSDLVFNYLVHKEDDGFFLRDHEVDTQDVQFIAPARFVLAAGNSFLKYIATDLSLVEELTAELVEIDEMINGIQKQAWGSDFHPTDSES